MAKNVLIYETLNDVKQMKTKKTSEGLMQLSGVFGVCGIKNNNSRIYEKNNYKAMVVEMQKRIQQSPILGELEHPATMNITLENVSHKIDSIDIDENGVVTGTITLLNTPKGKIAQAIVEGGAPLFISSRAQGNVDANGVVTLETLQTYDLVGSPGFSQAKLHLNENQVVESICESCFYIEDKSLDEGCCGKGKECEEECEKKGKKDKKVNKEKEIKENNENINMDDRLLEKLANRISALEAKVDEQAKIIAEGVESWVKKEYTPVIENWIMTKVVPECKSNVDANKICEAVQKWVIEEYSPELENWVKEDVMPECGNIETIAEGVQKWVIEEYSPEIQKWIVEHYSPEVQRWIVEHYSPEVEKWITEEYSNGVEGWVVEHFAPEIQNWIVEEYSPAVNEWTNKKVDESIAEGAKKDTKSSLESIQEALKLIDTQSKPVYNRQVVTEALSVKTDEDAPKFIREMPEDCRAKWNMASDAVKESIYRRSKLYNFMNEGAIQKFWESINFEDTKPIENVYEGLDSIEDARERAIRAGFRRNRKF